MRRLRRMIREILFVMMLLVTTVVLSVLTAEAMTVYESDEYSHAEGYIFMGACHAQPASMAMGEKAKENWMKTSKERNFNIVFGVEDNQKE